MDWRDASRVGRMSDREPCRLLGGQLAGIPPRLGCGCAAIARNAGNYCRTRCQIRMPPVWWGMLVASRSVLEIDTLPQRHPNLGVPFRDLVASRVVIRLSIDPVRISSATRQRGIAVDRVSPKTKFMQVSQQCEIGWNRLPNVSEEYCEQLKLSINAERITEDAAIGIDPLLIHELEGCTISSVLQIGSGGDYLIFKTGGGVGTQVEVSGIREDPNGSKGPVRLREKCQQVLQKTTCGFASVTTFSRLEAATPHSYLHYVKSGK